ncbi:hypothetical protein [Nonomuraea sp. GTA35]
MTLRETQSPRHVTATGEIRRVVVRRSAAGRLDKGWPQEGFAP